MKLFGVVQFVQEFGVGGGAGQSTVYLGELNPTTRLYGTSDSQHFYKRQ